MTKYLISFPGEAMVFPEEEFQAVADAAHAVIDEAKSAGVYVFGGGIDEDVAPVLVAGDGTVTEGTYPGHKAVEWAAKIAVACRCPQEVRQFQFDPAS